MKTLAEIHNELDSIYGHLYHQDPVLAQRIIRVRNALREVMREEKRKAEEAKA